MTMIPGQYPTELRFAPAKLGQPASNFWKFWTAGDEVYATVRNGGHDTKISMHQSGRIHARLGAEKRQILTPPLIIGDGCWLHALEIRFLLSPDSLLPQPERMKKNKRAFMIDVPAGTVLILNIIIAISKSQTIGALPHELLPAAQVLWTRMLRRQVPVVITARLFEKMSDQDREAIRHIREERQIKANFSEPLQKAPYVEINHMFWSPAGGNVMLVIPMGQESFGRNADHIRISKLK